MFVLLFSIILIKYKTTGIFGRRKKEKKEDDDEEDERGNIQIIKSIEIKIYKNDLIFYKMTIAAVIRLVANDQI